MFFSTYLKKFKKIHHCFFSKKKGFSKGIYKSLNCGIGSNDNKKKIIKNLNFVSNYMGVKKTRLILMNQTHSNKVIVINNKNKKNKKFNSDALITKVKGIALGVLTADCVPILLYDKKNEIIGCIHAGWKGSISGIINNTISKFKKLEKINEIYASVGPCIGKKSYEVNKDFLNKFKKKSKNNLIFFKRRNEKFLFDLRGYVNKELKHQGVKLIDNIDLDTFQDHDNFFSYRRSQKSGAKDYGRCISTICLKT
tara:strand:- start:166 stop:924 length:759 start_codon:yes stop_codon:yes gene_type:complete